MKLHRKINKFFKNPKQFFADAYRKRAPRVSYAHLESSGVESDAFISGEALSELESTFKNLIANNDIKIISFDVFDTLITRPLEEPHDLFHILMLDAQKKLGLSLERLVWSRIAANIQARRQKAPGEMTYEDVYDVLKRMYGLNNMQAEALSKLEIAIEKKLSVARSSGRKLWNAALSSGKSIICISDMYLSAETIQQLLNKSGYDTDKCRLFVSSDCNCFKSSGLLYDHVLKALNCAPEAVLHVGDSSQNDIEIPSKKGISTLHLPSARTNFLANQGYKKLFPIISYYNGSTRVGDLIIPGLIARRLFDSPVGDTDMMQKSLFMGSHFNLGYAALGPIILAYILWLGRDAASSKMKHLFFLSRDGLIFKKAYEILFKDDNRFIKSSYLYTSSRAARMASLKTPVDIANLALQLYHDGVKVKDLLKWRFGLNAEDIPTDAMAAAGYNISGDDPMRANSDGRYQFINLCSTFLANQILARAEEERQTFSEYLRSERFASKRRVAVVDIGWNANSVAALQKFFKSPMNVYYYNALQMAASKLVTSGSSLNIKAFTGHYFAIQSTFALSGFPQVTEYLLCCSEPSLEYFKKNKSFVSPVFRQEAKKDHDHRKKIVDDTHQGIIAFISDVKNYFSDFLDVIHIDPVLAERVYASFVKEPSRYDAMLLYGACYENRYAGVENYVVAPNKKHVSLWLQGHKAVHGC